MDPRLRAAVDASLAWYDDVFALHRVPTRTEAGLWWALGAPPPWHSGVKTTEPGVETARVLAVHEHGAVADSFGDLDLGAHGFELLIDATWVHHAPLADQPSTLPDGWIVVRDARLLAEWNRAHDYTGVLLPGVLEHPRFRILARLRDGVLTGGAVTHDGGGAIGLSNAWGAGAPADGVLRAVAALHPGRAMTDYAHGPELDAMVTAGYTPLGPQRVWLPREA